MPPLSAIVNARLQAASSDVRYDPEVPGGRTRPDGVEIKWELSTPAHWGEKMGASRLPFFCGDITPRELRVYAPHLRVAIYHTNHFTGAASRFQRSQSP